MKLEELLTILQSAGVTLEGMENIQNQPQEPSTTEPQEPLQAEPIQQPQEQQAQPTNPLEIENALLKQQISQLMTQAPGANIPKEQTLEEAVNDYLDSDFSISGRNKPKTKTKE